jgi:hypothetical protein
MATRPIRRYALVPNPTPERDVSTGQIRRFQLARVAVSPRSALGADRHERMEDVVAREPGPSRDGAHRTDRR